MTPSLSFLTEQPYGQGTIVMLGSMPAGEEGDLMLCKLIDHYAERTGVTVRSDVTKGTLVCPRSNDQGTEVWTIVNMDGHGEVSHSRGTDMMFSQANPWPAAPSPLVHMSTE